MSHNYKRDALKHLPNICSACGETDKRSLTADHIVPRSSGGSDKLDNLRVLCVDCHRQVTNAYRRSRYTRISKDGKVLETNKWKSPQRIKYQRSRSRYASRLGGW